MWRVHERESKFFHKASDESWNVEVKKNILHNKIKDLFITKIVVNIRDELFHRFWKMKNSFDIHTCAEESLRFQSWNLYRFVFIILKNSQSWLQQIFGFNIYKTYLCFEKFTIKIELCDYRFMLSIRDRRDTTFL